MHLVLQVHTEDALRAETDSDMDRIAQLARRRVRPGAGPPHRRRHLRDRRADAGALDKVVDLAEENRYAGRDGRWQIASRGNGASSSR